MTESLPATAVLRVASGSFDPGRFADVDAVTSKVSGYLIPAIQRLPGLDARGEMAAVGITFTPIVNWTI